MVDLLYKALSGTLTLSSHEWLCTFLVSWFCSKLAERVAWAVGTYKRDMISSLDKLHMQPPFWRSVNNRQLLPSYSSKNWNTTTLSYWFSNISQQSRVKNLIKAGPNKVIDPISSNIKMWALNGKMINQHIIFHKVVHNLSELIWFMQLYMFNT